MDSRTGYGGDRRAVSGMASFGGRRDEGRDLGGFAREQLPLPTKPPFTAHLGNLPFDITSGDIEDFFSGCQVTNVRIVEDKLDHKPKGFGYVEFETLDGLKAALQKGGTSFQGRNIRISVAEPPKERAEARELNDWTRKGPLPDLPNQSNQNRRASDRIPTRSADTPHEPLGMERGGSRRGGPPEGDGKFRDFSNWERRGPPAPLTSAPQPPPSRDGGRLKTNEPRSFERRPSPAWGERRSQEGSRPPRPVPERQPTAAEQDTQWRSRMRPDPPAAASQTPTPEASTPSSPAASAAPLPAGRPKLNLQKRTVSEAPTAASNADASDAKASPFGAARPIDTATREQEIEQKRIAARQKKEEEDREREAQRQAEKAATAAAKSEKGSAPPTPGLPTESSGKASGNAPTGGSKGANRATSVSNLNTAAVAHNSGHDGETPVSASESGPTSSKENGGSTPSVAPGRQFEILRRVPDQEGEGEADVEHADGDDAPANGTIVDDKAVKPKELVRDMPAATEAKDAGENSGAQNQPTTADALSNDGWSTVGGKEKPKSTRGRGGRNFGSRGTGGGQGGQASSGRGYHNKNAGSRALAS
ncbi:MAG: hypothetical protein M1831_007482 [Alyxoria varia]|nr:MAG: hypothetical protein M1831_007482 [Alyxoria varia]